jgi:two-component system sensor histidine kinase YesM
LGDTFNIMMDQIQSYYQKEFDQQKRKSELEFQVLQAQINPHFLYNTLDSIKWLAVLQNMNNIADMCTSLINLLKYNLAQPGSLTTLSDEVENLKNYIRIQKFRYGDTFEFSTQLDPETHDCEMLRFVLQPLVENCIIHAFEDIEDKGFIKVLSFIENGKLHIEVIDNGSGMDLATVYTLNQNDSRKGKRFNTIGIHNIKERIRLQYGNRYGLYYISEPGVGTIAEMVLPVIKKED